MGKFEKSVSDTHELISTLVIGMETHTGLFDELSPKHVEAFYNGHVAPKLKKVMDRWESLRTALESKKQEQVGLQARVRRLEAEQEYDGVDKVENKKNIEAAKKDLEGLNKEVETLTADSQKVQVEVMMLGALHKAFSERLGKDLPIEAGADGQATDSKTTAGRVVADNEEEAPAKDVPQVIQDFNEVRRLLREGVKGVSQEKFSPVNAPSRQPTRGQPTRGRRGRGVQSNSTADLIDS